MGWTYLPNSNIPNKKTLPKPTGSFEMSLSLLEKRIDDVLI